MEAVGLVASIVTLISATSVASTTLQRLWGLRGSSRHIAAALNELNDFKAALCFVHEAIDGHEDTFAGESRRELEKLIYRAETQLQALNTFLQGQVRKGDNLDAGDKIKLRGRAKVKEILGENQSRIDEFRSELLSIKTSLGVALSAMGAIQRQRLVVPMTIEALSVTQPGRESPTPSPINHANQTVSVMEEILSPTLHVHADTHAPRQLDDDSYVEIRTQMSQRRCRIACPCQCHVPTHGSSPRWLQQITGVAFFNLTGTPIVGQRPCNLRTCGGSSRSVHFQYVFPRWLLSLTVEVTGHWKDLHGLGSSWTFRIPRLIPKSVYEELMYFMKNKLTRDMEMHMESKGVRAIDIYRGESTLFNRAIDFYNEEACIMLLDKGCNLEFQTSSGITQAQYFWRSMLTYWAFETTKRRPEIDDALDSLGLSPIHKTVLGLSNNDLASLLDEQPALIDHRDRYGFSALHWAVLKQDIQGLQLLIAAGADVNALCIEGRSPLSWAAELCDPYKVCTKLLDAGADINLIDNDGMSALSQRLTRSECSLKEINLLLQHGAVVNYRDKDGQTPLMHAVFGGSPEVVQLLLDHGADIDEADHTGWTVIWYATWQNDSSIVRLLRDRGATLNCCDDMGDSLINMAAWYGSIDIMRILQEAQIEGLQTGAQQMDHYWSCFRYRNKVFIGHREPFEDEEAEFWALLDSIIPPMDFAKGSLPENLQIPGSFPLDANPEDEEVGIDDEQNVNTKCGGQEDTEDGKEYGVNETAKVQNET